jgi:hypothetical protein
MMEQRSENYGLRLVVLAMHPTFAPSVRPIVHEWMATVKRSTNVLSAEDCYALSILQHV